MEKFSGIPKNKVANESKELGKYLKSVGEKLEDLVEDFHRKIKTFRSPESPLDTRIAIKLIEKIEGAKNSLISQSKRFK